jgi:hypothetical protein
VAVPRPFLLRSARNRVRAAARVGELPDDLTLAACRHGGITELGDAELTEQGVMAMTGYKTPDAARIYLKRTESSALLVRGAGVPSSSWRNVLRTRVRKKPPPQSQNEKLRFRKLL